MSTTNKIIAIACADIHLSHEAPIWRSNEPDWYAAMKRPLDELSKLQRDYKCPVLCAGDVFHNWNAPAELINFAYDNLPNNFLCVPGQHDLPNHNEKELGRSAYGSLIRMGTLNINASFFEACYLGLYPFGKKLKPIDSSNRLKIALSHQYVWSAPKNCYRTASEENKITRFNTKENYVNGKLFGYDIILFGDNHIGFKIHMKKTIIVNCGSLMRRHKDQVDYKPKVWCIFSNGDVVPWYLDVSKDKHLVSDDVPVKKEADFDMEKFAFQLKKLGTSALDFSKAIDEFCERNKVKKEVKEKIEESMKIEWTCGS